MLLVQMKAAPVKTDDERLGNEFMSGVFFSGSKWLFVENLLALCKHLQHIYIYIHVFVFDSIRGMQTPTAAVM